MPETFQAEPLSLKLHATRPLYGTAWWQVGQVQPPRHGWVGDAASRELHIASRDENW